MILVLFSTPSDGLRPTVAAMLPNIPLMLPSLSYAYIKRAGMKYWNKHFFIDRSRHETYKVKSSFIH
ncbi:hypothetical protein HanXRQr2_Chr02g0060401 [Helianthus annuus]|uniref:Uncharacterized protein n=1 Tax=Helianthus annuus TaxID=4232 RepID=A0A251VEX1_HELAN|nr:hypothetical protein HanXRQr2_Chr02g0060401 [Helianthus annuus]